MDLTTRRYAPALFGILAFLIIAASPCPTRASSDEVLDVPALEAPPTSC